MYVLQIRYLDTNRYQLLLYHASHGLMKLILSWRLFIQDQTPKRLVLRKERKKAIFKGIEMGPDWEACIFPENAQKLVEKERANNYQDWIKILPPMPNINEAEVLEISSFDIVLKKPKGL